MRSLVGSLLNRSLVPYAPRSGSGLRGFGWGRSGSDMTAALEAMGGNGTLFAIAGRLAQATSSADWCLYRKTTDNRRRYATTPAPRVEITKHPALEVWNNPNPHMTQQLFIETVQQHMELVGETEWAVAEHDQLAMPAELWPVRPDKMQPIPSATEFLAGWVYQSPDGEKVPLGVDEVIQMKSPNPTNPYRGMGAVQTILMDLDSDRYSAEWNRNFFINGAQPGGVIEFPETLTDDQFRSFQARWREGHQGVAAAHKIAMLEDGMKWVDVNFSQKDMQFAELRSLSREVIREAFGYPKPMLGAVDNVNRANAEAGEYVFARWLIEPRLDRIKDTLNSRFLPMFGSFGEGVEFDYHSPVPENEDREASERTSKTDAVVKLIEAGFDPTEVLDVMGLPQMTFTKGGVTNEPA